MKKIFLLALTVKVLFFSSCFNGPEKPDYITAITIHSVRATVNFVDSDLAIKIMPDSISFEKVYEFLPGSSPFVLHNFIVDLNIYTLYDYNTHIEAGENINLILRSNLDIAYTNINQLEFFDAIFRFIQIPTADAVQFDVFFKLKDIDGNYEAKKIRTNKLEF